VDNITTRLLTFRNVKKNTTCFCRIYTIKYAKSVGASAIAHGSTGAGNDQIRFDLIFQAIARNRNHYSQRLEIIKTRSTYQKRSALLGKKPIFD
jgi:argininosuccinate synthase